MGTFVVVLAAVVAAAYTLPPTTMPPTSISHTDRSELSRHLSVIGINDACLASALDNCVATPQESQSTPRVPPADWSALFDLLHDMGFSDVCVASALDACAGVAQGQLETLLKEARDLQQETRDLQQETRDLQQEGRDSQQETRDLQQEGRDLQQETRDLLQEGRDSQQETRDLQQEGRDLLQETRDLQQETRDLKQEERDLHQETRDLQQGTRNLQQETRDLHQEERDLLQETRDLQQGTRDLQQDIRDLQQEGNDLLQETRDLLQHVAHTVNKTQNQPRHCKDLLDDGDGHSGVRVIYPYPGEPERRLRVYCDQTTDGRGWTVFQRRTNSTVREDFYRPWAAYKEGFGLLEEEFWLGLDALHALTSTEPQELRIDLADWEGGYRYAKYSSFSVDDHEAKYRLTVGGYSGTAGNSLTPWHTGKKFTTHDSDNDTHDTVNCAEEWRGAWWYSKCHNSNLNGYQYENNPSEKGKGIVWDAWRGSEYSLRRTTMMLRPAQQN